MGNTRAGRTPAEGAVMGRTHNWKRQALRAAAVLVVVALMGLAGLRVWISWEVAQVCAAAQEDFPGDDVQALVAVLESDAQPLKERNRAIWALGHLRDARALPALEAAWTGQACNHDEAVCQYELRKALGYLGKS